MMHNKLSQHDLRSGACFCAGRYAVTKIIACTPAAAAGRYALPGAQGGEVSYLRVLGALWYAYINTAS